MPNLGCVIGGDGLVRSCSGFHQRYEQTRWNKGSDWDGMNLVGIEEHQVGDLVLTQVHYLYISLEATSACVTVPIAKVPQT